MQRTCDFTDTGCCGKGSGLAGTLFFSASGGANKSSFSVPVRCLIFLRSRSLSLPSRWYSIMLLFALQFDF